MEFELRGGRFRVDSTRLDPTGGAYYLSAAGIISAAAAATLCEYVLISEIAIELQGERVLA